MNPSPHLPSASVAVRLAVCLLALAPAGCNRSRPPAPAAPTTPTTPTTPAAPAAELPKLSSAELQHAAETLRKTEELVQSKQYDKALDLLTPLDDPLVLRRRGLTDDVAAGLLFQMAQIPYRKGLLASHSDAPDDMSGLFPTAITRLQQFLRAFPGHEKAPLAAYFTGTSNLMLGNFKDARDAYKLTFDKYPDYTNRGKALLRMGVCQASLGEASSARTTFLRVVRDFPDVPRKSNNATKARRYLKELLLFGKRAARLRVDSWLNGLAQQGGLDAFQGEVIVLIFFATWCTNCESELPHLRRIIRRWEGEGVVFLGLARPDDPKNTMAVDVYVRQHHIPFQDVGLDRGGKNWSPYSVSSLPAAVLIGRDGRILWRGHTAFFPSPIVERALRMQ